MIVKRFTEYPGHVPGDPLVPGAALLGWVEDALEQEGWTLHTLGRIRFLAPVRPGDELTLRLEVQDQKAVFSGIRGEEVAFRGSAAIRSLADSPVNAQTA